MILQYFFNLKILILVALVFVEACGLSLVVASRGCSSLQSTGFSLWWLLLLQGTGSRCWGFSSCGSWAQQLWLTGLGALRHVESSQTRFPTPVPCIGRQILKHWTSREVLPPFLYQNFSHPIPSVSMVLSPPYLVNPSIPHVHLCMTACSVMSNSLQSHGLQPTRLLCPQDFPGKNTGVGCHFLLQDIFLTQASNPVSPALAGRFFTTEPLGKPLSLTPETKSHFIHSFRKDLLIKTVRYWHKNRNIRPTEQDRKPKNKPMPYGYLIFDKRGKNIQWGKDSLVNKWENWTATC